MKFWPGVPRLHMGGHMGGGDRQAVIGLVALVVSVSWEVDEVGRGAGGVTGWSGLIRWMHYPGQLPVYLGPYVRICTK